MRHMLKRFLKDENGGPAIEFGVVASFIAIALPGMFDVAAMIDNHLRLTSAMRAGLQYAVKYPSDTSGIEQAIEKATGFVNKTTPTTSGLDNLTVTKTNFCECAGISTSCTGSCSYGVQLAKYTNITMAYNVDAGDYNYDDFYPTVISKTIAVRTQ